MEIAVSIHCTNRGLGIGYGDQGMISMLADLSFESTQSGRSGIFAAYEKIRDIKPLHLSISKGRAWTPVSNEP